jgi:hypothetical protein
VANLRTNSDLIQDILFRSSEPPGTVSEFYPQAVLYYNQVYQSLCSGGNELDPEVDETWWWLRKPTPGLLTLQPALLGGSAAVNSNSPTVTFSSPPLDATGAPVSVQGWFLQAADQSGSVYQVEAHTPSSVTATLDGPYVDAAANALSVILYPLEYTLAADCKAIIGPMRTYYTEHREISASEKSAMRKHYPLGTTDAGIPRLFAPTVEVGGVLTVQFSHFVQSLVRVEYDYLTAAQPLADDTGEPLVPFQYRTLLAAWAAGMICVDKDDSRATNLLAEAKARLQAMAKENRRRQDKTNLRLGQITPRLGNMMRWRLQGELYQAGYSTGGVAPPGSGGGIDISNLPTTLPPEPGVLWNNGGVLCIS